MPGGVRSYKWGIVWGGEETERDEVQGCAALTGSWRNSFSF